MNTSVELTLLKCVRCGTLVPAQEEEVAWVCAQCGQGLLLTADGLAPLTVSWAGPRGQPPALRWLPFWVFLGTVHFTRRESHSGSRQPDPLWKEPRRFYIPAFPYSLENLQQLGADLVRRQPQLQAGQPAGLLANCTLLPEDARPAVEFVILTIEAEQKDKLRFIDFKLDLQPPELWLLPFTEQGGLRPAF